MLHEYRSAIGKTCGAIRLKKAVSFLIFRHLGVEVFENPKVNFHVHSSVKEYWAMIRLPETAHQTPIS
jgi:hypothetical protein